MKKFYLQVLAGLTGVFVVFIIFALFQMQFNASEWHGAVKITGVTMSILAFIACYDITDDQIKI